jgi:hypothetical protein
MATIEEELLKLTNSTTEYLQNSTAFVSRVEAGYKAADVALEKKLRDGLDRASILLIDGAIFRYPEITGGIDGKLYIRYLATGVARCFFSVKIVSPSPQDQDPYWSIRLPDSLKQPDPESFGVGNTEFNPSTRPERLTLLRPCAVGTAMFLGENTASQPEGYVGACTFGKIIDEAGAPDRNSFVLLITIPVRPKEGSVITEIHAQWDYIFQ